MDHLVLFPWLVLANCEGIGPQEALLRGAGCRFGSQSGKVDGILTRHSFPETGAGLIGKFFDIGDLGLESPFDPTISSISSERPQIPLQSHRERR